MNMVVKMLLASLEKDANNIPTEVALGGLMAQIDDGVKGATWPMSARLTLMHRIEQAAHSKCTDIMREDR